MEKENRQQYPVEIEILYAQIKKERERKYSEPQDVIDALDEMMMSIPEEMLGYEEIVRGVLEDASSQILSIKISVDKLSPENKQL